MEIILAMAIATMVTTRSVGNSIVDGWHGFHGRPSPRMQRAAERRQIKAGRTRGAFTAYLADLWRDSWTDVHDRHIRRRNERLSREPWPRGAFRSYLRAVGNDWRDRWDDSWDRRADRRRSRPAPEFIERSVPNDWTWHQDGTATAKMQCPDCKRFGVHSGHFDGNVDYPAHLRCQHCGRSALYDMTPDEPRPQDAWRGDTGGDTPPVVMGQIVATADTPVTSWCGCCGLQHGRVLAPGEHCDWCTAHLTDTTSTTPTTEGNTTMPTTTAPIGEVTGLATAITNTGSAAASAEAWGPALEQLAAGLTEGDVGGGTTGHLATAQEHFAAAAGALRQAEAELMRQLSVKEAYDANPDAGTREFVTAE